MATSQRQPLLIPAEIYDAMISHCIKASPLACCGILAGIEPLASAIYPLRNAAESPTRYRSDPPDLTRAFLDLRSRGLAIVAIYHFVPGTAAVPSPTDLRENYYGDLPRVIVSLAPAPLSESGNSPRNIAKSWTGVFSHAKGAPPPRTPRPTPSGPMSNRARMSRCRPLFSDRSFPACSGGGGRLRGSPSAAFQISHPRKPNLCGTHHWTVSESETI